MGIFHKIFNFGPEKIDEIERRMEGRYSINPQLPIKIHFKNGLSCKEIKIVNISRGGLKLSVIGPSNDINLGDMLNIHCKLEEHNFDIMAKVVYIDTDYEPQKTESSYRNSTFQLGMLITHSSSGDLWPYYQVVYPIILGHSLQSVGKPKICEEDNNLERIIHLGEFNSNLVFWHTKGNKEDQQIIKFELSVDHLLLFGNAHDHFLEMAEINPLTKVKKAPDVKMSRSEMKMAFKFYKWFLLHLNDQFPDSTKRYLKSFSIRN